MPVRYGDGGRIDMPGRQTESLSQNVYPVLFRHIAMGVPGLHRALWRRWQAVVAADALERIQPAGGDRFACIVRGAARLRYGGSRSVHDIAHPPLAAADRSRLGSTAKRWRISPELYRQSRFRRRISCVVVAIWKRAS